jgi:hypothetical protein
MTCSLDYLVFYIYIAFTGLITVGKILHIIACVLSNLLYKLSSQT